MIIAGIDVGSNAIRLLINEVVPLKNKTVFRKIMLLRLPIRLGDSVFTSGTINEEKKALLIKGFNVFKSTMEIYKVEHFRVCATSAFREASNGQEVADYVKENTGVEIQIINGKDESEILYNSNLENHLRRGKKYLYMDVGGGSTELVYIKNKEIIKSRSFRIGTVRLLKGKAQKNTWGEMHDWLLENVPPKIEMLAVGGNINKMFKISNNLENEPITLDFLLKHYKRMKTMTLEKRMKKYLFNVDRADVIVPALKIFTTVCSDRNIQTIRVPKIGIVDGIVKNLYREVCSK